ncbi:MAG TPA: outer membrane protein assembly factor BamE [Burkholderiaceae bacterium]|jgi:outer membrane protein assembly factor BamE|nr:outer membrane protein assembly factor BamE [Burkholderiaceae bacterium]
MQFFPFGRITRIWLAMAIGLTGCASKTPLMGEPVAASGDAVPGQSAQAAPSSVKTIKERRFLGIFSPYRVDIQQGNFVSREIVAQLKESMNSKGGMTPDQVRFVMGTPLLMDVFHKDRWDYPFRLEKSNGEIIISHVALFFENNRLVRIEGGDLPTEENYLSLIAGTPPAAPGAK